MSENLKESNHTTEYLKSVICESKSKYTNTVEIKYSYQS